MLDFYFTLQKVLKNIPSHKTLRQFALKHQDLKSEKLLFSFLKEHLQNFSLRYIQWFYLISFILGITTAIALLSYNGKEPVNLFYFLFIVIGVPLLGAIFTIISFFTNTKLFIGAILEKIIVHFTKEKINFKNKTLQKWFELKTLLFAQLLFGFGFLLGFLFKITFSDIAFTWSSTLDISVNLLYKILQFFSLPWHGLLNDYLSISLIQKSQFYHLQSAKQHLMPTTLSLWWKYLLFASIFYMIILRFILFVIANSIYKKTLNKAILDDGKVLLHFMKTPLVSTKEQSKKEPFSYNLKNPKRLSKTSFKAAIAWNFTVNEALILKEKFPKGAIYPLSALDSFEKEDQILQNLPKEALSIIVKSWEAPTMDFIDFLEKAYKKFNDITIFLIGENYKKAKEKELAIWQESLKNYPFLKFALV